MLWDRSRKITSAFMVGFEMGWFIWRQWQMDEPSAILLLHLHTFYGVERISIALIPSLCFLPHFFRDLFLSRYVIFYYVLLLFRTYAFMTLPGLRKTYNFWSFIYFPTLKFEIILHKLVKSVTFPLYHLLPVSFWGSSSPTHFSRSFF